MKKIELVFPSKRFWLIILGISTVLSLVMNFITLSTNKSLIDIATSQQTIIDTYQEYLGLTPKGGETDARDIY